MSYPHGSYERVWDASVDWFATRNIRLRTIDKSAGYLDIENFLEGNPEILNCGTLTVKRALEDARAYFRYYRVRINVTVRKLGPLKTRVNVNLLGIAAIVSRAGNPVVELVGPQTVREEYKVDYVGDLPIARCEPTGVLESAILNFIKATATEYSEGVNPSPKKPFERLPEAPEIKGQKIEI